jgi:hypothetical protein
MNESLSMFKKTSTFLRGMLKTSVAEGMAQWLLWTAGLDFLPGEASSIRHVWRGSYWSRVKLPKIDYWKRNSKRAADSVIEGEDHHVGSKTVVHPTLQAERVKLVNEPRHQGLALTKQAAYWASANGTGTATNGAGKLTHDVMGRAALQVSVDQPEKKTGVAAAGARDYLLVLTSFAKRLGKIPGQFRFILGASVGGDAS